MKHFITSLLILTTASFCYSQSLDEDKIYATKYRQHIFLDNQLHTKDKKIGNKTIFMLESNDKKQVTRELHRLSDSTFLYTEYHPMSSERYLLSHGDFSIYKQGILVLSDETLIDSTVMYDYDTYEAYPNPRERNIFKPMGTWIENYYLRFNRIRGSYNSKGKHGVWEYYSPKRGLDKKLTYDNNTLMKEEIFNLLLHQSIEKTRAVIQKTWSVTRGPNTLSLDIHDFSNTYAFEQDGTFVYTIKKRQSNSVYKSRIKRGTWSLIDYKTIQFVIENQKTTLNLNYMSENNIGFLLKDY